MDGLPQKGIEQLLFKIYQKFPDLESSISECTSDLERMSLISNLEGIDHLFETSYMPKIKKISRVSEQKREEGNRLFQLGHYEKAVSEYSDSLTYACPHCEDESGKNNLALTFANRSAALFHLEKYKDCLKDIEEALKAEYPEDLQHKLYARMGRCYFALNSILQGTTNLDTAKKLINISKLDYEQKDILRLKYQHYINEGCKQKSPPNEENSSTHFQWKRELSKGPSATHANLSCACKVIYTETKGRCIIADEDIKPGEVLLVEKPLASVIVSKENSKCCNYCFKQSVALLPCLYCPIVRFCSKDCRAKALQSYHRYECGCLNVLTVEEVPHEALRVVTTLGLDVLLKHRTKSLDQQASGSNVLSGCNAEGKYNANDYETFQHFAPNSEDIPVKWMTKFATSSFFLVKCLEKSHFFATISTEEKQDVFIYVASELLGLIQRTKYITLGIDTIQKEGPFDNYCRKHFGAGLYGTACLINHSCDPSAYGSFFGNLCVLRATRTIRKGEEVSISYGVKHGDDPKALRQIRLQANYSFTCTCIACVKEWPLRREIVNDPPRFKCDKCHTPLPKNTTGRKSCPSCGVVQDIERKKITLTTSTESYTNASFRFKLGYIEEPLQVFLEHIAVMDKLLVPPFEEYDECEWKIVQCFSIMDNGQARNDKFCMDRLACLLAQTTTNK